MKFLQASCFVTLAVTVWFENCFIPVDASPLQTTNPRKRHEAVALHLRTAINDTQPGSKLNEKRQECEYGSWRCLGQDLQRCFGGQFGTMITCAADELCSTEGGDTGCVWAWQKTAEAGEDVNTIPTAPSTSSTASASTGVTSTSSSNSISGYTVPPPTPTTPTFTWSEATTYAQSHNLSTLVPEPTSTPLPNLGTAHYVIYSDAWLTEMPHQSAVQGFNKFILAFWLSDKGPVDNAAFWEKLTQVEQLEVIKGYKAVGITLMVSAFGATDKPITAGRDPIALARSLADGVRKNNMAGVDIDLEDNEAMNKNIAIPWIVAFQKELRAQLPRPFLISHAPQAPWFTSANKWQGGYLQVDRECGDGIDFYNIQWYNQGEDQYHTCETLLFDSGPQYPDTSGFQIHNVGRVKLNKLVIGKTLTRTGAANGYMDPGELKRCVELARGKGWDAGVMYWEWDHTAQSALRAVLDK